MKILLSVLLLMIGIVQDVHAQKENNNWAIIQGLGLTFSTSPPSVFSAASHPDPFASSLLPSAVSDANGNLLFYTVGNALWDRNHQMMPNGDDVFLTPNLNNVSSLPYGKSGAVVIVPDPGDASRYYVIAVSGALFLSPVTGRSESYRLVKYSVVDMDLNAGKGDVVQGMKNMLLTSDRMEPIIQAVGTGHCKKWILFKKEHTNQLHAFEISATGISATPVISQIAPYFAEESDLSNDNTKLVIRSNDIASSPLRGYLHLYNFDINTGVVSNGIEVDNYDVNKRVVRGLALSGDNSKLYCNESLTSDVEGIHQYDLSLGTQQAIINSKKHVLKNKAGRLPWDLTFAPDGKIYQFLDSGRFAVIHHPDRVGFACDVKVETLPGTWKYGTGNGNLSMHNHVPSSSVTYSYADFNSCSLPVQISSYKQGASSYVWNTGAGTQQITVTQNGIYWVKATDACGASRIDTFKIDFNPPRPINDTFSCNGQPLQLTLQNGVDYKWHNSEGALIKESGQYAVTISREHCGSIEDTFNVHIYPASGVKLLPVDTVICNDEMAASIGSLYDLRAYQWNTGATTRDIRVAEAGVYTVTSTTPCGIFSDSVRVALCKPEIFAINADTAICEGACVSFAPITGNYPQRYSWSFFNGSPAETQNSGGVVTSCFNDTGTFDVMLIVANNGGADTFFHTIKVLPKPQPRFVDTAITVPYKAVLLIPECASGADVSWYKNDKMICSGCNTLRLDAKELLSVYQCVIKNATCTDTCNYTVHVTGIPTDAWLPTAFSPNGDGKNDFFKVVSDNPNITIVDLSVFNRFGQRVFRANDNNNSGWNGYTNGQPADQGTYFWYLSYKVQGNPEQFYLKGDVILVR